MCTFNAKICRLDERTERSNKHRRKGNCQEVGVKRSTPMTVAYLCDTVSTLTRHHPSVLFRFSLRPGRR